MRRLATALLAPLLLATGVAAGPSPAGALDTACTGRPGRPSGTTSVALTHAGHGRNYLVHVPRGYDPTLRTPVVLDFHGARSSAQAQLAYSEYVPLADAEGVLVVAPNALASRRQWVPWDPSVDDVGFVAAVINDLTADFCVDVDRIHATGISSGGIMSSFLACRLSNRIASVTTVAGTLQPGQCTPRRPVPVLAFHGDRDELIPYEGGRGISGITFPPVRDEVREWARRNGCRDASTVKRLTSDAVMRQWRCDGHRMAKLVRIERGGHTWPGASIPVSHLGRTTRTISATDRGWSFFENHPRVWPS